MQDGTAGRRAATLVAVALALAGLSRLPAVATDGDGLSPGIIGHDDRVIQTRTGPPFDAVGQVNVAGFRSAGQCTGTLVAPGVVITAAHCLVDPSGRPFPPGNVHFLAAVRRSESKGHATARCLRFLDRPVSADRPRRPAAALEALAGDAAAIVLDGSVDVAPAPLAEGAAAVAGLSLAHVAYPADRRFMPVIHDGCRLLGTDADGALWFNDCDTHPGSSGGPVFVTSGGTYRVGAIQVAAGSGGVNVALALRAWGGLISEAGCP
jgi:protease YdgD